MKNEMIEEKVLFFLNKKIMVHLEKEDGQFYNGIIIECSDKHLIIDDRKVGECFVFYSEIIKLEPYKVKEETL